MTRPFRFLHAADLHLDSPFRGAAKLPEAIRSRIMESTFDAFRSIVELAIVEQVDFVIFSGDIYDAADRSLKAQLRFQAGLQRLAERDIPVFVAHGNHDPDNGRKAKLAWPAGVRFFPSSEVAVYPVRRRSGELLAYIHGISYAAAAVSENLARRFTVKPGSGCNIGVLHCNVDGNMAHDNYAPCTRKDLIDTGIDYWALGHIHTRSILHEQPFIVYPGNVQGRSVKEQGPKGCCLVDVLEGGEMRLSFHATDHIRWFNSVVDIGEWDNEQQLKNGLEQLMRKLLMDAEGRSCIVRLTCTGKGPMHGPLGDSAFVQELLEELRNGFLAELEEQDFETDEPVPFAWIESIKIETSPEVNFAELMLQEDFMGDMLRLSARLADNPEALEEWTKKALHPMLNSLKTRKFALQLLEESGVELLKTAERLAVDAMLKASQGGEGA